MTSYPEGAEPLDRIESRLKRALHFQQDSDELSLQDKADLDAIRERLRSAGAQQDRYCPNCRGDRWVCENHRSESQGHDEACGGAGEPCPACNPAATDFSRVLHERDEARAEVAALRSNTGAQPASEEREPDEESWPYGRNGDEFDEPVPTDPKALADELELAWKRRGAFAFQGDFPERVLAALRSSPPVAPEGARDWRPIAEAPKDGAEFVARRLYGHGRASMWFAHWSSIGGLYDDRGEEIRGADSFALLPNVGASVEGGPEHHERLPQDDGRAGDQRSPLVASTDVASAWVAMDSAPTDGTEILAAVYVHGAHTRRPLRWERHVIAFDEDRGEVDLDYDQGWRWADYSHWMPLPTPPGAARPHAGDER